MNISLLLVSVLNVIIISGCSKESNIVPPYGSTITMPADTSITAGTTLTVRAPVQDPKGLPMNGVGVIFRSSSSKASFSSTSPLTQTSIDTDKNGIATVNVFTNATGIAVISGDIKVKTASTKLTITR